MNHSKQLLLKFLLGSGLLRLLVTNQRNKITILMLHGVIDTSSAPAWTPLRSRLTTEQLSQTLSVLAQYYNFVSLPEVAEMLSGIRPIVPNSLALTFDDGYRNSLIFAVPVLRKFKAPATIFLCTGNVTEQTPFWFDRLDYAVQSMNDDTISHRGIPELAEIDFSNRERLISSFISFIRKEKKRYQTNTAMCSSINNLIERIEQRSGHGLTKIFADDPFSGVLTWEEVRQIVPDIHYGSHGVNHLQLNITPPYITKQELIRSREAIEFHTGHPCTDLAYPFGSFNDEIISMVKICNYHSAVTTKYGINKQGDNLLTLRRIAFPRTNSPAEIIATVSGLTNQLHKINNKLS